MIKIPAARPDAGQKTATSESVERAQPGCHIICYGNRARRAERDNPPPRPEGRGEQITFRYVDRARRRQCNSDIGSQYGNLQSGLMVLY